MKEKIIQMLGNGLTPSIISKALGCDPSYISQLMADEGIRLQVAEERIKDLDRAVKADDLADEIEFAALEKMRALLPFVSRPLDAARIYQTVNGAKRKTQEVTANSTPTAPLVQIQISQEAAVKFRLSSDQQVVEVDGRSMSTLPVRELNQRLKDRADARPAITDQTTAAQLIKGIEDGIPEDSLAHVL